MIKQLLSVDSIWIDEISVGAWISIKSMMPAHVIHDLLQATIAEYDALRYELSTNWTFKLCPGQYDQFAFG